MRLHRDDKQTTDYNNINELYASQVIPNAPHQGPAIQTAIRQHDYISQKYFHEISHSAKGWRSE